MTDPATAAKAMELGERGYPSTEVARRTGLAQSTAYDVINRLGHWGQVAETSVFLKLRAEQKLVLQTASMLVSAKALIEVEKKIEKASAYQAAGIYGLLRTHERLDAGEPTQITASSNIDVAVSLDTLAAALSSSLIPTDVTPATTSVIHTQIEK
jgi:hypothetical protein